MPPLDCSPGAAWHVEVPSGVLLLTVLIFVQGRVVCAVVDCAGSVDGGVEGVGLLDVVGGLVDGVVGRDNFAGFSHRGDIGLGVLRHVSVSVNMRGGGLGLAEEGFI